MIKNLLIIGLNTLIIVIIFEFGFKIYDLSQPDYFDNKKKIISYYSNFANHPFINYTSRNFPLLQIAKAFPLSFFPTNGVFTPNNF